MHNTVYKRILEWRKKYDTPNGWAASQLIGSEYADKDNKKRKKRR